MIHPIKLPEKSAKVMLEVLELVLEVLDFTVQETGSLTEENFCARLEDHLKEFFANDEKAAKAAEWFNRKKATVRTPLLAFSRYPEKDEKSSFLEDIRHDIQLLKNPTYDRFKVALTQRRLSEQDSLSELLQVKNQVGSFLEHLYTLFKDGAFTHDVIPNDLKAIHPKKGSLSETAFTRQDFIGEFVDENENLFMCVMCDAVAFRLAKSSENNHGKTDYYTTLEHYFPKSIYPHLSIHPYNLVPICGACNTGEARTKDPLEKYTLADLLLPYQSETSGGLMRQAYLKVGFADSADREEHPLKLEFKPSSESTSTSFIDSFNAIYNTENRWNKELTQIEQHIFRRVSQFFWLDMTFDEQCPKDIAKKLEFLIGITAKHNLGNDAFSFAMIWMLRYYADSLHDENDKAAFYIGLKKWTRKYGLSSQDLLKAADEFKSIVPKEIST